MKRLCVVMGMIMLALALSGRSSAQSQEVMQLILNFEKLNQFKSILKSMYDGYKIVSVGYTKVKDIASGNYKLHEVFLDGLYLVNPEIKKYSRVAEIIRNQGHLIDEYKSAFSSLKGANVFNEGELSYLSDVYSNLFQRSLDNLDELLLVLTSGTLRMSDDERLAAIDRIAVSMEDKLLFLRSFNEENLLLAKARVKTADELQMMRSLHGINEEN